MTSTDQDRLPPSAPESELAILGCCLLEPSLARGLNSAWFYDSEAQILAGHLRGLADRGETFDCVSIVPALREQGIEDPIMLGSQCIEFGIGPSFFKTHAAILSDFARKRRLLEITATGTSDAMSAITDGSDILLGLEKAARAIRDELPEDTEEQGLPEIISGLTREYEAASLGKGPQGVTTGFNRLDKILGPMLPGQLHILAARPGCGKTSLALGI
ncbi:MAG TPA: DnaB-like helicase C-terminal domain-containing protein, partial [Bacillota bacterium]|nr:DnaB-like helicase C-terminal domain-containing protein [Bacillota bacterium]